MTKNNTNTNKETLKAKAKRIGQTTAIATTAVTTATVIIDVGVGVVRMIQGVSPTKVAVAIGKDIALTAAITAGTVAAAATATEITMALTDKWSCWNNNDDFDEEFLNIDDEEFSKM